MLAGEGKAKGRFQLGSKSSPSAPVSEPFSSSSKPSAWIPEPFSASSNPPVCVSEPFSSSSSRPIWVSQPFGGGPLDSTSTLSGLHHDGHEWNIDKKGEGGGDGNVVLKCDFDCDHDWLFRQQWDKSKTYQELGCPPVPQRTQRPIEGKVILISHLSFNFMFTE